MKKGQKKKEEEQNSIEKFSVNKENKLESKMKTVT